MTSLSTSYPSLVPLILLLLTFPSALSAQPEVSREVMGSGGGVMENETYRVHGTLSQTTIGRTEGADPARHNVGFWYWARVEEPAVLVALPRVAAAAGERITVPLMLESSRGLRSLASRRFTARIRYNGSLLEPLDSATPCTWENGACIITVTGTAPDSAGLLIDIPFRARLGTAPTTPLEIEEFRWESGRATQVMKRHGEFFLLDLCVVGDTIRLFFDADPSAITLVTPNPVDADAVISYALAEDGPTELILVDALGRVIDRYIDAPMVSGRYTLPVSFAAVPVGKYFLLLRTTTSQLLYPIEVRR